MTTKRVVTIAIVTTLGVLIVGGLLVARTEQTRASDEPPAATSRMRAIQGPAGREAAIVLSSAAEHRLGIATRALEGTAQPSTMRLTGRLTAGPAQITIIRSLVAGRLSADTGRWPALGEHVVTGAVLGQVSDARPLVAPRAGTVTRVSAQPGDLVSAGEELLQLTDFRQLIARIVWGPGAPRAAPRSITLSPLTDPAIVAPAELIGPDAQVDSLTGESVFLYRTTSAWAGARPGALVVATVATPGVVSGSARVPADAVVQWQGLAWAYVRHDGDSTGARFVRRRVDTSHPVPGGWLVTSSDPLAIHAGDTVVVRGAQELLSEEFRSRITVGDEDQP